MRKFPKVRYPGDQAADGVLDGEVVVTEKLDGANFRFTFTDSGLRIGTRNHEFDVGDPNIPKAFTHAIEFVQSWPADTKEKLRGAGTFFGEAMHRHSITYDDVDYVNPSSGAPYFGDGYPNVVLFDWWQDTGLDLDEPYEEAYSEWADWDLFEMVTEECDLPTVPMLWRGDPDDLPDEAFEVPDESVFGGTPEGIVVRRVDGSVRAKKVTDEFKEANAQAFDDPSKAQSDAGEFVAAYITKPRIEKVAHKLVDEGDYDGLEMPMMEDLPRAVIEDAVSEHAWSLFTNNFECDFDSDFKGEVRSKASKKCARVLKQAINSF